MRTPASKGTERRINMKWGLRSMLCLAAASVAGASVIGIDFGSSYMKVRPVSVEET